MSIKCAKYISVSCVILALLISGIAIIIAAQGPASVAMTDVAVGEEHMSPFEFRISPERPRSVNSVSKAATSQDVHLPVSEISLHRYDIYYTDEGCILALLFTSDGKPVDLSKTLLGLGLRTKSGDLMMSAGGSLWAHLRTSEQPDPVRQGPFTLWITLGSIDLDMLAQMNGKAFASDAAEPYVEIYLSSSNGITYAGYDGPTDYTSPFIKISGIQLRGR
jgi:hypothetical protein